MKKLHIALAMAATVAFSGSANAANGIIDFKGELVNITCSAKPGAGSGTGDTFDIDFGKVAFDALSDGSGSSHFGARPVQVLVECSDAAGLSIVKAAFDPAGGSGVDALDPRLLAFDSTSTSSGAGIAVIDDAGNVIDLSGNDTIDAPLIVDADDDAIATINMQAAYILNGARRVPGINSAQLPFTLTFE